MPLHVHLYPHNAHLFAHHCCKPCLTAQQVLAPVELQPLRASEVEVDEFEFVYSMTERPSIQNDLITINYKLLKEHMTKARFTTSIASLSLHRLPQSSLHRSVHVAYGSVINNALIIQQY